MQVGKIFAFPWSMWHVLYHEKICKAFGPGNEYYCFDIYAENAVDG